MAYPAAIHESQVLVEASRPERILQTFPHVLPEEKENLLRSYHPDYIRAAFRELQVGLNRGDLTPGELADVLESAPIVCANQILSAQSEATCDVLVIGGGGAPAHHKTALWRCKYHHGSRWNSGS
jgi:hypothetical protein